MRYQGASGCETAAAGRPPPPPPCSAQPSPTPSSRHLQVGRHRPHVVSIQLGLGCAAHRVVNLLVGRGRTAVVGAVISHQTERISMPRWCSNQDTRTQATRPRTVAPGSCETSWSAALRRSTPSCACCCWGGSRPDGGAAAAGSLTSPPPPPAAAAARPTDSSCALIFDMCECQGCCCGMGLGN